MLELTGDFGSIVFEQVGNNRYIQIPVETAVTLWNGLALKRPNITENALGLYSRLYIDRDLKARLGSLTPARHLLKPRASGCAWNPSTGRINMNLKEIDTFAVEYPGEECPDALWDGCLERIFGPGLEKFDFNSTPEAKAMFAQILEKVYIGLGNSVFDLAEFGAHPKITSSDTNTWYSVEDAEWDDYKTQQDSSTTGGWITLVDSLRDTSGLEHFNVSIQADNVSGTTFSGDVEALFDSMLEAATPEFEAMIDSAATGQEPVILVSKGIFQAYEDKIKTQFGTVEAVYRYYVSGENGELNKRVLQYKGLPVVKATHWGLFDTMTGVTTHRALLTARGNLGIAHDVVGLPQFGGMGMKVLQRLDAPYNGKVYLHTAFRMGTAILDSDFMVNASRIIDPS